jgi:hypothetical protein
VEGKEMDIWAILNGSLSGVVIGAVIAGASGYYQSKRQQEYEYRKDLAAAIRTAYADFLKAVFEGGEQTEAGMAVYLGKLRAAYGPVSLLGSEDVKKNIEYVLEGSRDILERSEAEEMKMKKINELMEEQNVGKLRSLMWEDVSKWQNYLER